MRGDAVVAEILKREGVEYLFCFPYNPLIDAAAAVGIRPIMTRTERTLVNMADGYSRVTNGRRLGVATVQAGPGAENAFAGVAQAYSDSVPLLFLPGHTGRHRKDVHPEFDGVANYRGVTKWAATVNDVARVPEMFRRAFSLLRTGRGGPVLLEVPFDVCAEEFPESTLDYAPPARVRSAGDPADVEAVAKALCAAELPVLHVGQGVLYAEATDELVALAEALGSPVVTTLAGKSAFPEDHALAAGYAGHTGTGPAYSYLREADLVFGVGASLTKALLATVIPPGKVMVQATNDPVDLHKDYPLDHAILGDVKLVLAQLVEAVHGLGGGKASADERGSQAVARRKEWLSQWMPKLTSEEVPINPYRVVWDLNQSVDRRHTIVTHDSGSPRDELAPFYETPVPRGYLGWGKSTQLGYSLGLIMGAKLACPDKLCVNVMGDGAFGMAGLDLETAARAKIGVVTIVLNNSALGNYEKLMPIATERYGLKYLSGDYARIAEGLGAFSQQVREPKEIIPALERAQEATATGRPALLEIITREEPAFSKAE
jgi:acetolactate synthase-1/2/3 large subunit